MTDHKTMNSIMALNFILSAKAPVDERGSNDGEHQLVNHVGLQGNGGRVVGIGLRTDAVQEHVLQAADKAIPRAETQAIANQSPKNGDDGHHGEALHHGGQNVLLRTNPP